ncbi:MAG: peptidase S24 [Bacteroidia bacterium]|nr:peptidase S24 [Bacteroidia bacterium]
MHNQVSKRFIECIKVLKKEGDVRSFRQFAIAIDIHPQCISDVITGKREVSVDMISKSLQHFNINPNYLYTGKGAMILDENETSIIAPVDPVITIVTDQSGNERIVYVPVAAQAGYGQSLHNPEYIRALPTFTLPGSSFQHGSFRCFDVAGDSMEPTIFSGEKLICSFVEKEDYFRGIKDNYVYIIITRSGVLVKRVQNMLKQNGQLMLVSDNSYYTPYAVELDDITEVWKVTHKISVFMPSPKHIRHAFHTEVDLLKDTISDQSKLIRSLNATVEKLLKQNRSTYTRL